MRSLLEGRVSAGTAAMLLAAGAAAPRISRRVHPSSYLVGRARGLQPPMTAPGRDDRIAGMFERERAERLVGLRAAAGAQRRRC